MMDSALFIEDEPFPVRTKVPALCVLARSAALPPPCLPLKGPVIHPDLGGNISASPLYWTETDTQPLKAFVAVCGDKSAVKNRRMVFV